jgi:hypothetical protein
MSTPLTDQEKFVLDKIVGEGLSGNQVSDLMHVTGSRVSQIKLRALAKLGGKYEPPRLVERPALSRHASHMKQLDDAPACARCGLRGAHECLRGDATARRGDPFSL